MAEHIQVTRALFDEVMVPNYAPAPIIPVRGQGSSSGIRPVVEYIDFAGGIAVKCFRSLPSGFSLCIKSTS